jgi:DNA-binding beta-propeller fold protein YncE
MPSAASELELDPNNGIVAITEFAGRGYQSTANGVGTNAGFNHPYGVNIFGDGQYALIADANSNRLCRAVISTQTITTIAGGAFAGGTDGVGSNALFSYPTGISISPDETFALVTDFSNSCIRRLEMSSGSVSTVAGVCSLATNKTDGFGTNVGFANPYDISVSPDGTYALITDTYNSIIRRMDIATGEVTTVFGVPAIPGTSNGVGTNARLQGPYGLDISSDGTFALVADSLNHIIRHIDLATSTMTTIAGGGPTGNGVGTNARFFNPRSIKISPGGTAALITEVDSHLIRHLDISTGSVTTFAGSTTGSANGFGTNAQFISPGGISIYRPPNVNVSLFLVGDTYNHLVRRGQYFPDGVPLPSPTESPTAAPTVAPTSSPTTAPSAAPTEFIPYCAQLLSFDDAHGSYSTWMTSFLKYDGYFSGGDDDDDYGFKTGYIPFMSALQISGVYGVKPTVMLGLRDANVATFSVVPGKLDASGDLMPCEIESTASGPCFNSRSWEVGLSAKSFFNSVYSTETDAWIAPFGSSMTNECFQESEWGGFFETRLRPVSFTGEGRSDNNVPPPSFHVPPPLPHHSVEVSLTLKDEGGFGWWNTIKYHSNQYVLDDGEKILHRGTLVGKSQVTEKVSAHLPHLILTLSSPSSFSCPVSSP